MAPWFRCSRTAWRPRPRSERALHSPKSNRMIGAAEFRLWVRVGSPPLRPCAGRAGRCRKPCQLWRPPFRTRSAGTRRHKQPSRRELFHEAWTPSGCAVFSAVELSAARNSFSSSFSGGRCDNWQQLVQTIFAVQPSAARAFSSFLIRVRCNVAHLAQTPLGDRVHRAHFSW